MKLYFLALTICLALMLSMLSACSPTTKADKHLEESTYILEISFDVISVNERIADAFYELETTEAKIWVDTDITRIRYTSQPAENYYKNDEYWITEGGYIYYRYLLNNPPRVDSKRIYAKPAEDELDTFLLRATSIGGVTADSFGTSSRSGNTITYTDFLGAEEEYLRDMVLNYVRNLSSEIDVYREHITLLDIALTAALDAEGRYTQRVLRCDYRATVGELEYEFSIEASMAYDFEYLFNVQMPDDYFDDRFVKVPYDDEEFAFLNMPPRILE